MNLFYQFENVMREFAKKYNWTFESDESDQSNSYQLIKVVNDFELGVSISEDKINKGIRLFMIEDYCLIKRTSVQYDEEGHGPYGFSTLLDSMIIKDEILLFSEFDGSPILMWKFIEAQILLISDIFNNLRLENFPVIPKLNYFCEDLDMNKPKNEIKKELKKKILKERAGLSDIEVFSNDCIKFMSIWEGKDYIWERNKKDPD